MWHKGHHHWIVSFHTLILKNNKKYCASLNLKVIHCWHVIIFALLEHDTLVIHCFLSYFFLLLKQCMCLLWNQNNHFAILCYLLFISGCVIQKPFSIDSLISFFNFAFIRWWIIIPSNRLSCWADAIIVSQIMYVKKTIDIVSLTYS